MTLQNRSIEEYVKENEEQLQRVIKHSDDTYARACAWALLDSGSDGPEIEQLRAELDQIQEIA